MKRVILWLLLVVFMRLLILLKIILSNFIFFDFPSPHPEPEMAGSLSGNLRGGCNYQKKRRVYVVV